MSEPAQATQDQAQIGLKSPPADLSRSAEGTDSIMTGGQASLVKPIQAVLTPLQGHNAKPWSLADTASQVVAPVKKATVDLAMEQPPA